MITLDIVKFRATFPEFADPVAFPDAAIQAQWDLATSYVSAENVGDLLDDKRAYALMLCTAHLLRLGRMAASSAAGGGVTGVVTGAQVDKVNVTLAPPPMRSLWEAWLAQTPYGQQLGALLQIQSRGGFYVGGLPERAAFRKVGGVW